MYDYCVWKTHYASLKNTHAHSFHTNCSRPKHCKLARHFSLTTKPTEPSERNTRERELPASVCVRVCEVRALSVEFHVEAAVRLRRSRGGEQRGRKTTSLFFFFFSSLNFSPCSFFSPSFELWALHTLDHGCHIPHCVSEGVCAALCSALSAMYNCSRVLLLCQECSQTHRHSQPWHAPTHKTAPMTHVRQLRPETNTHACRRSAGSR